MPRTKSDPLLAALIAKLPASETDWPVDRQLAWLNLMAMAFGAVYGGDAAARLGVTQSSGVAATVAKPLPPTPSKPTFPFIIDEQGFARNAKGKRIVPAEITDALYDLRGLDGDMKTIVWADESQGLNGRDLTIIAA